MIIRRNGTARDSRLNKTLSDNSFRIDQRAFWDIMGYISSFLENINYYNIENKINGDWKTLIEVDPVISMVIIINTPLPDFAHIVKNTTETKDDLTRGKIEYLLEWYRTINNWSENLYNQGEKKLADKIKNVLSDVLEYYKESLLLHKQQFKPKTSGLKLYMPSPPKPTEDIDIDKVINTFQKVIIHIQKLTKIYLEENILSRNNHMPNNAMYIAFAMLFRNIQNNLNSLSERHLDFYYKDILIQEKNLGKPTRTIVSFDLLPAVQYSLIDKGTQLNAGKLSGSKTDIIFETAKPLVAYQIELTELKTLFFNTSPYIKVGTNEPLISCVSKNDLIVGSKEIARKNDWFVFGANKQTLQNTMILSDKTADIGFIAGSPVLFLSEGKREIVIRVNMDAVSAKEIFWELLNQIKTNKKIGLDIAFFEVFNQSLKVSYTTQKGWVKSDNYSVDFSEEENCFTINIALGNSDPALCQSQEITEKLKWPSVKVELNEYAPVYLYSFWKGLKINTIEIIVNVQRIRELSLYNNVGSIALGKPFDLFGPFPKAGAYLMIGKSELFQKQLNSVEFNLEWDSVPSEYGGFDTYYEKYQENINNDSFKVQVTALSDNFWLPVQSENIPVFNLFETHNVTTPEGYQSVMLNNSITISIEQPDEFEIIKDFNLKDPLKYSVSLQSGFFKITLTSPAYGFGNDLYQKEFTAVAIHNAKNKDILPFPKIPFVPKIKGISVNYKASDILTFNEDLSKTATMTESAGEFLHITPFGTEKVLSNLNVRKRTLVCDFEQEGYLYLGLSGIKDNTTVAIFFHLLQSCAGIAPEKNGLLWEYFQSDGWVEFERGNIIQDDTNGFFKSGIIEILLPKVNETGGEKKSDIYRIRVSAKKDAAFYPVIKGIYLNAVEAVCCINSSLVTGKEIPAGSINKIAGKIPDVKKVLQPTASYGGVPEESDDLFYSIVSERLRHKGRALSVQDFEQIVLDYYKDVRIVKCTNLDKLFNTVPGNVTVVVLGAGWSITEKQYYDEDQLSLIKNTLKGLSDPFINIRVINPEEEYLLTNCIVEFEPEDNGGYYLNLLNDSISDYLSPISGIDECSGGIGGSVVPGMLASYLENLYFVKGIKNLTIEHIVQKETNRYSLGVYKNGEIITASKPWSVLVPVTKHRIVSQINNNQTPDILNVGIGNMEIGLDFILEDNIYVAKEDSSFPVNKAQQTSGNNVPNDAILIIKNKN